MDKIDKLLDYIKNPDYCRVCNGQLTQEQEDGEYFTCSTCGVTLRKKFGYLTCAGKITDAYDKAKLLRNYKIKLRKSFGISDTEPSIEKYDAYANLWIILNKPRKVSNALYLENPGCGCCGDIDVFYLDKSLTLLAKIIKNAKKQIADLEKLAFPETNLTCTVCEVNSVENGECILCGEKYG